MQLFETLFLITLALAIFRLISGPMLPWLRYSYIVMLGILLIVLVAVFEVLRWQMIPAYLGFVLLALATLKRSDTGRLWRVFGALPLVILLATSTYLVVQVPVLSLPSPSGPYGVGTFDFSITDDSRLERYAPERNRELYVEVWYPADKTSLHLYPVRTLFQEIYEGKFSRSSFMFGYLEQVDTHSHSQAPIAATSAGPYPVLLFNHALDFGFTSQNTLLMEHLASHGYVILSIAHPYQGNKVNLAEAGSILRADSNPADLVLPADEIRNGIIGTVFKETQDIKKVSQIKSLLFSFAEHYLSLAEEDKTVFIEQSLNSAEFAPFKQFISEDLLKDFIYYDYIKDNSLTQYWVEDNQFITDSLMDLPSPIAGFSESLDVEKMGVFGMSYGGSVAGEFCKIDSRCMAGVNIDGTQFGQHWNQKLPVPFLMLYNDEHQGGNDFAYMPPQADFWDYHVISSSHTDFTDFIYLWPILKDSDFSGNIEGMRMMDILNTVHLDFFDIYLKGKTIPDSLHVDMPEIVIRRY